MKIRRLEKGEFSTYDKLASQYGSLFNRSDWVGLFGDNMHVLGIYEDGGEMIGGLSLYQERRFGLKILRSAPFTPTCGPFIDVKALNPVAILETRRKALECIVNYIGGLSAAIVMLPLDSKIVDTLPFFWGEYKVIPNYTYRLDLSVSLEQMSKNMSSERRKNISKAGKDGLTVRQTTDMSVTRDLVLSTFRRQKKFVDEESLDAILFRYANPSNSFAFTTSRGELPIATCFIVHDVQTAYYLLGGYCVEEKHHGAGASSMFQAIKHSKDIGLKIFDFEGSVIPAIERYFRGFGGELTPYFTVNKAWLPLEIALKFVKQEIF